MIGIPLYQGIGRDLKGLEIEKASMFRVSGIRRIFLERNNLHAVGLEDAHTTWRGTDKAFQLRLWSNICDSESSSQLEEDLSRFNTVSYRYTMADYMLVMSISL